jgi:hypothetical protein
MKRLARMITSFAMCKVPETAGENGKMAGWLTYTLRCIV